MGDGKYPIYILGPCAAESREQVMETAKAIGDSIGYGDGIIFRAGAWKPRTSPHTFKGVGKEGLQWLQEVKAAFGVPVATEVATPEHVQLALEAGIDYLWIGARTSASPIAVENIAEVLSDALKAECQKSKDRDEVAQSKKTLKGILIKNPVNADAQLWLGNIERLEKAGVPVMAVHRGCNHQPCWNMAHTVRTTRPDIPMLLDPSHLSGDAAQVPGLLSKVEELGLDGAMIEVHYKPSEALSDASQQITPDSLTAALKDRCAVGQETELNWLRAEIDELDEQLWSTIEARMEISERIGKWKKAHGVPPLQPERYNLIVERLKSKVASTGLDEDFMLRVWDLIHEQSLKKQS